MKAQDNSAVDEEVLAALGAFIDTLRESGQQPEQSYKLETSDYFDGLRTRLKAADNQERAAVLDEILRTGKVADEGLTTEEHDLYMSLYGVAEAEMNNLTNPDGTHKSSP